MTNLLSFPNVPFLIYKTEIYSLPQRLIYKIWPVLGSELWKLKTVMDMKYSFYMLSAISNADHSMGFMKSSFTITPTMVLCECSTHGYEILELAIDHMLYCLRDMRGKHLSSANIHCKTKNRIIEDLKFCDSLMTNLKSFFILNSNCCSKEYSNIFIGTMLPLKRMFLWWKNVIFILIYIK